MHRRIRVHSVSKKFTVKKSAPMPAQPGWDAPKKSTAESYKAYKAPKARK